MTQLTKDTNKVILILILICSLFVGMVNLTFVSADAVEESVEDVLLIENHETETIDEVATTKGLATLFKGILTAVIYVFNLIADFFMNLLDSILQT